MKQQPSTLHGRLLSAIAIGLSIALLTIVANTLQPSISTTVAPDPPTSTPEGGISLLALIYQLLNSVLALFGISLDSPPGRLSGGSALEFLVAVLQTIYQHRLTIITATVVLVALGLLYQYRHRLAVPHVLQSSTDTADTATDSSTADTASSQWPPEPDSDSIQDAWIAMVRRVDDDVTNPSSRTPAEWQEIAIAAGLPADEVETITETFCAVQYGAATESDTRLQRVQAALDAFDTHQEVTDD